MTKARVMVIGLYNNVSVPLAQAGYDRKMYFAWPETAGKL